MKLRKSVLLILILAFCLSFVGCGKTAINTNEVALTVGDAGVDAGVFAYFLDTQVKTNGENANKADAIEEAEKLCAEYVKVNTEFKNRELSLSGSAKGSIAAAVDEVWNLYGGYYEKIGVSKETVTKIKTSDAYKEMLVSSVFGAGGDKEISEDQMKTYFNENYIFFKYMTASLTGDAEADKATTSKFKELKDNIGREDPDTEEEMTFEDVNKKYSEETGEPAAELNISTMKKGSDTFPEKFFTDVLEMEVDSYKVLSYDENIFLVQKVDGSSYFGDYKTSILDYMTNTDFETLMTTNYKDVKIVGNENIESNIYLTIKDLKTK